jgi:hypothetical protein
MSTPIQFIELLAAGRPKTLPDGNSSATVGDVGLSSKDNAVAPELQVRYLRSPGKYRKLPRPPWKACSNGRRHALSGPRMLQRRTDGLWGGGYRAAAAPKNAWTAAPGPLAPCRDRA